ncbi:MAG: transglutaminase domain-containing protein [Symploca sp. SIO2C1]|nr:transglutaminase domain-containing protein [Symploca sp. SIO2C1]
MNIPPLLLGATLLFWGWQTGLWIIAVPSAILLEVARFLDWQWELTTEDFQKIANLCLSLLVILIIYLLVSSRSLYFIYALFQWLPVIFLPLVTAQVYSTSDRIDLSALFLLLKQESNPEKISIDFRYLYFALCILAASAANTGNIGFYLGMSLLVAVILWFRRSQRFYPIIWLCLMVLVASIGFVSQMGLHQLHLRLEQATIAWLSGFFTRDADPNQKSTAIGDLGRLKLSNGIVFRVAPDDQGNVPQLLRESTYNKYQGGIWVATNSEFDRLEPLDNETTWLLAESVNPSSEITISAKLDQGQGLLKLPDGSFQVEQLPILELEQNQYGTVKVAGETNFISYEIQFNPNLENDSPPTEDDLQVPLAEQVAIQQVLKELDVAGKSSQELMQQIQVFFQSEFNYSLDLAGKSDNFTPLSTFLLQNRSGHCEYFAAATTLLLRSLGIPARYAIGYSVHEFSSLENQYLVRARHGHAWTLVYLDGRWQEFDTTPASWIPLEDANTPTWGFISDWWSWLSFQLTIWIDKLKQSQILKYWWWLVIPVVIFAGRQFNPKRRVKRLRSQEPINAIATIEDNGVDSEFYTIEQLLQEMGFARNPSESLKSWLNRLQADLTLSPYLSNLQKIVELHYRYRFDPQGITTDEREQLKQQTQAWIEEYRLRNLEFRI